MSRDALALHKEYESPNFSPSSGPHNLAVGPRATQG